MATNNLSVLCPECSHEFELSESLLGKFRAQAKSDFENWKSDYANRQKLREQELVQREEALEAARENNTREVKRQVSEQVSDRLKAEYPELVRKARAEASEESEKRIVDLQIEVEAIAKRLSDALAKEAELLKGQRELKAERDQFEYEKQKAISAAVEEERANARADVTSEFQSKFQLQNVELERARKTIDELNQKLKSKPSQELQGEALEVDLEVKLSTEFPLDEVTPIKKGQRGADILQVVNNRLTQPCGSILWESKRAQHWGGDWIQKLKQDQRESRATVAIIVSQTTPPGIEAFDIVDNVWIVKPEYAVALAAAIREGLLQTSEARKVAEGMETKAALVYRYLMSDEFKGRFGAIVDSFVLMQKQLIREKNAATKAFNQREKQHETVIKACFGVIGDLQGIAGQDLKSLEEIEIKALPVLEEFEE